MKGKKSTVAPVPVPSSKRKQRRERTKELYFMKDSNTMKASNWTALSKELGSFGSTSTQRRYRFEVIDVIPEVTSQGGSLTAILRITGPDIQVTDRERLILGDPRFEWRLIEFAKAIGIWRDGMTPEEIVRESPSRSGEAIFFDEILRESGQNTVDRYIVR